MRRLTIGLCLALASCGGSTSDDLIVFAASSLAGPFGEIATAFEGEHPGVDVQLNFAGSTTLREQLLEGAPADVFAAADPQIVNAVTSAGIATGAAIPFATNRIVLAVPPGNPAAITGLADLADPGLLVGVCAPQVPCGTLARAVLAASAAAISVDTEEPDVRSLVTKLEAAELDAGLVYASDIGILEEVPMPAGVSATTVYPIVTTSDHPLSEAFVAFVLSAEGRRILSDHGFELP